MKIPHFVRRTPVLASLLSCASFLAVLSTPQLAPGQHSDPEKQSEHEALHGLLPHGDEDVKAVQNGSWFSASTWNTNSVPATGQDVLIPSGYTVTYNGTSNARLNIVRVDGTLQFAHNTDNKMIVDSLLAMASSQLLIGSESNPVQNGKSTRIIIAPVAGFNPADPEATAIDTVWDWHQLSRGVVAHGTTRIYGQPKTVWKQLNGAVSAGATSVTLASAPTNWAVGDRIVITGTQYLGETWVTNVGMVYNGTEDEVRTITAISGATITLDTPLDYAKHDLGNDIKGRPMRGYVANYTRNVSIETEGGDTIPTQQRGHAMFMHSADVIVKYALFEEMGRTDKTINLDDILVDEDNKRQLDSEGHIQDGARTNIRGRYPFHFHRTGTTADEPTFALAEGNALWSSPGLGYVHHDSAADFINNASYNVQGSHYVGETGNEIGIWQDNIAILGIVRMGLKNMPQIRNHDVGRPGSGYWFVGRIVGMVGNVAAGMSQGGVVHMTRGPDGIWAQSKHTEFGDMSARYKETVNYDRPHIHNHNDNVVLASGKGFGVVKSSADQEHAARSLIKGLTAWHVGTGVDVQYTNFYSFFDLTAIAQPGKNWTGIYYNQSIIDMAVNNAYVEGFVTGVKKQSPQAGSGTPTWGSLDFPFVDLELVDNGTDFANFTTPSLITLIDGEDLVPNRLYMEFDGAADFFADPAQTDRKVVISGYIWDSIKAHPYKAKLLHPSINNRFLEGHYLDSEGNKIILIEEPIVDAATGETIILEIPVTMHPSWNFNGSASLSPYLGPYVEATPTNVALNASVTADSVYSDGQGYTFHPEYAVDGLGSTSATRTHASRWLASSANSPHWLEIDFTAPRQINQLKFWIGHAGILQSPIPNYQFDYWDGSAWQNILDETGSFVEVDETFTMVTTTKVRFRSTTQYVRVYEIEVYGY